MLKHPDARACLNDKAVIFDMDGVLIDSQPVHFQVDLEVLAGCGVFAELELSMIRERIKSGVENARAKGKRLGRPPLTKKQIPDIFFRYYPQYAAGQLNKSALARVCSIKSRNTIRKYLRIAEEAEH